MDGIVNNIQFLRELLNCVHNLYFTEYDAAYNPIYTNAPNPNAMHIFLSIDLKLQDIAKAHESRNYFKYYGKPALYTNSMGMTWIADIEMHESEVYKIHVLGPVFLDDYSIHKVEKSLQSLEVSAALKMEIKNIIKEFPVIPLMRFYEYGIMLHYCLSGERMAVSEFTFPDYKKSPQKDDDDDKIEERHGTYTMEQQLMKFVEEGNINYRKEKDRIISYGNIGKMAVGDYMRQTKNMIITHTALCCRAAIRGGMAPETAYMLSDRYIQSLENSNTIAEAAEISNTMYDDYIQRVHQIKTNTGISHQIQACCDYISLHLNEKLDVHALASSVGYTDYYFTKKFKQEIGLNIRDYATQKKIERAKDLLRMHVKSIQDISDELGFSSQSYFGELFHKATGMSPGEYRNKGNN